MRWCPGCDDYVNLSAMQKEPIGDLDKDKMYDKAEEMKSMPTE